MNLRTIEDFFLDDELLHLIVDQTNCTAYQRIHGADSKKWHPVTPEHLKRFCIDKNNGFGTYVCSRFLMGYC